MGAYLEPFDKEFLKRTKAMIRHSDLLKYNVTFLINCTLSLICLPIERCNEDYENDGPGYDSLFSSICDKMSNLGIGIVRTVENTPPKAMLKCLRNGIAHLQLQAVNGTKKIRGIQIKGSTRMRGVRYECSFEISKKQLKQLSIFIVDEYAKLV